MLNVGNFTFIESSPDGAPVVGMYVNSAPCAKSGTCINGIAVRVGSSRFALNNKNKANEFKVNCECANTQEFAEAKPVGKEEDGVSLQVKDGVHIIIRHECGIEIVLDPRPMKIGGYIYTVKLPAKYRSQVKGLLGNFDGNPENDLGGPETAWDSQATWNLIEKFRQGAPSAKSWVKVNWEAVADARCPGLVSAEDIRACKYDVAVGEDPRFAVENEKVSDELEEEKPVDDPSDEKSIKWACK
jgi:hypothetical protein